MTQRSGRIIERQLAVGRVKLVNKQSIEAKVGDDKRTGSPCQGSPSAHEVPWRLGSKTLPVCCMKSEAGPACRRAISSTATLPPSWRRNDFARGVDHQVAWSVADRRLLVEFRQLAGLGVQGKRRHAATHLPGRTALPFTEYRYFRVGCTARNDGFDTSAASSGSESFPERSRTPSGKYPCSCRRYKCRRIPRTCRAPPDKPTTDPRLIATTENNTSNHPRERELASTIGADSGRSGLKVQSVQRGLIIPLT